MLQLEKQFSEMNELWVIVPNTETCNYRVITFSLYKERMQDIDQKMDLLTEGI